MKISLKNIGKIHSAVVEINGITVIAGENNTGKSTVGKALFSVFNSLYKNKEKIADERKDSVENLIEMFFLRATGGFYLELDRNEFVRNILAYGEGKVTIKEIENMILETIRSFDEKLIEDLNREEIDSFSKKIVANFSIEDDEIFKTVLQRRLNSEFNKQINNIYSFDCLGQIQLDIRNEQVNIFIKDDNVQAVNKRLNLGTEVIYIDDPFLLDEVPGRIWRNGRHFVDHRTHLKEKLYFGTNSSNIIEEIIVNSKLEAIYNKISSVCEGEVVNEKRGNLSYKVRGSEKTLDVRNLSTGMKTFAILKMLLANGKIEANGTIILDEPEIHLHPEWQLLFAELIVLLHKEFGLHILLNTHSPYFLNAIEVYTAKHKVDDKCKYYLAKNNNEVSLIEDVTNNIEEIYHKLAYPLQKLENERYSDD